MTTPRSIAMGAILAIAHAVAWAQGDDTQAIVHAMKRQFDRPEAPLSVAPVTVVDGYAVAGWLQSGKGGRALLQKTQGNWFITVCAGDGLKDAKVLEGAGMSVVTASKLSKEVVAAESRLGADVRQRFASFEGFLTVGGSNADKAHGGHHAPSGHAPSGVSAH